MPPRTLLTTALLKLLNAAAYIITWYALMLATPVREAYVANDEYGEYFRLQPLAPDTFELYVNNEWFESSQQYRITADNRVIPLSFKMLNNLAHIVLCFVLSFPLFALFKWLLRRLFRLPKPPSNEPQKVA
jgi:hypothetical protein